METRKLSKVTNQIRLTQWAGRIRERTESGQTVRSWCKYNGVNEKTYYYWQRRVREGVIEKAAQIPPPIQGIKPTNCRESNQSIPTFMELKATDMPSLQAATEEKETGILQVEVCGIRITADSDYPPIQLAGMIREFARL